MKFFKKFCLRKRLRRRLQAESSSHGGNPFENEEPMEDAKLQLRNDDQTCEAAMVSKRSQQQRRDITCSICLDSAQYPVKTKCGHIFCAVCMVTCWSTGGWQNAVRCPLCRQQVKTLQQCFSETEQHARTKERQSAVDNIDLYNRYFTRQPLSWIEYICDLPTMLYRRSCDLFMYGGVVWMYRIRILVCLAIALLYLLSPVDIISEARFGSFGLLDDVFVVLALAVYITVITRRFYQMHI